MFGLVLLPFDGKLFLFERPGEVIVVNVFLGGLQIIYRSEIVQK
jgi:hypothetical protein